MATRNGKIANLPNDIREHLNVRLLEGESGRDLAAWLNGLPEVQSILASHFNGSPISEVNLTHWRQGGYLRWFTERECFDSARALADGDSAFAETGLCVERLLNILTLRYGQLLLRWDHSSEEGVTEAQALSLMVKKARILQGISRSVLAIHRLQSRSPSDKRESPRSSASSTAEFGVNGAPVAKSPLPSLRPPPVTTDAGLEANPALNALLTSAFQDSQPGAGKIPKILSGQITAPVLASKHPRAAFKTDPALSEISRCRMTPRP